MGDQIEVTIEVIGTPSGRFTALRFQNVTQQVWYNWDLGVGWTKWVDGVNVGVDTPKGNPNESWYVAAYATNEGDEGQMTLIISPVADGSVEYTRVVLNVPAGGTIHGEWNSPPIPVSLAIRCTVTP